MKGFIMLKKIINRICNYIWEKNRKRINVLLRRQIFGKSIPTIFSCNCTGGIMYHDLGWWFQSPTVNLFMSCEDFIKFCENFDYYCSIEIVPYEGGINRDYPLCTLGDLTLYMVHYQSFEEARDKWDQRKIRINQDNIRIIATDRDGCTEELKERFEKLPYKKVMFTHLPDEKHESCFYIKGYEDDNQVGMIMEHEGKISGKRYYDQFDWVEFLTK